MVAPGRGHPCWGGGACSRRVAVVAGARARTGHAAARSRPRTPARRRAFALGHLIAKIPVAFAAGLLSVVTPCVLPLVPGYLSAVSAVDPSRLRSEEHTSELQSHSDLVCRLLLEKKKALAPQNSSLIG